MAVGIPTSVSDCCRGDRSSFDPRASAGRGYRIPSEPGVLKKPGPLPCLGIGCVSWKTGDIAVGDAVFADVGPQPEMREK
ncbi:hypothetical protein AVEN_15441-1 [Araneus ventricosus]|uniref:Uncharacterized protein n=1 Tax=Araneus ventricosus TaxID=182803 RepID=A0A4Y2QBK7_ARAVE|nr:hypothetical protein AVEN_142729-1 [Araneus ventricosus]GBN61576.1 hypothetical protein AVEN_15441-1 [Araneus ventricosus]